MKPQYIVKKLARQSVCACGFPAVKTDVPVGQEYWIPRWNIGEFCTLICGGCGARNKVQMIYARRTVDGVLSQTQLPYELFDWDEKPVFIDA